MKDLNYYFNEVKDEMDVIGIKYGDISSITVNTRAKRRWGQCKKVNNHFEINISNRLLKDDVPENALMNTIAHEILHTCKDCMNHGKQWQAMANLVNDCYSKYNIKRCNSSEEIGIKEEIPIKEKYKYIVVYENCGKKYYYMRLPKGAKSNFNGWICNKCKHESLKMITL